MSAYRIALICCAAAICFSASTAASYAKTAKACEAEWKANKPAIQAKHIRKKDFVAGCRAEADAIAPANKRTRAPKAERKTTTNGTTAKACEEQWKANKPAIQASGKRKKDFISDCRSGVATTTTAPAKQDERSAPAPRSNTPRETSAPARQATPNEGSPAGANQYASEGAAKLHCPLDTIVWVNTRSGIYHFKGHKDFGGTKMGAYMCEKDTSAQGYRAAKNEKHP